MAEGNGFDLGSRLKTLREAHDLSQRELAKRAGVSNAIISMIEQNRSSPSVGMLKKLLDGFPLSLAEFFALEAPPKPQIYFTAKELVELAGGAVSYRQVGRDMTGKAIQLMHEHYAPGADTGAQMLTHDFGRGRHHRARPAGSHRRRPGQSSRRGRRRPLLRQPHPAPLPQCRRRGMRSRHRQLAAELLDAPSIVFGDAIPPFGQHYLPHGRSTYPPSAQASH